MIKRLWGGGVGARIFGKVHVRSFELLLVMDRVEGSLASGIDSIEYWIVNSNWKFYQSV